MRSGRSAAKNPRRHRDDNSLPLLRRRLRPGRLDARGNVIHIEGDPGHPISEGTLCSKGRGGIQVVNNPRRLQKVLYRAPRGKAWEEKTWDWALERIAARVKETRDKTFTGNGERTDRQPHRGDRLPRRLGAGQRGGLSPRETHEGARPWCTSSTRPGSDTAPRSPVWRPRSAGER